MSLSTDTAVPLFAVKMERVPFAEFAGKECTTNYLTGNNGDNDTDKEEDT